uniref:Uncharacterized protein n=1 Tax=Hemiselmis andersenii TaxID=464988 RepID=A0A6T8HV10_HEMAN|mmetsp:Transcript_10631/g.24997  ORF Transcript_10631/g.24997 Transcript_10631/m.24997 type:complete len:242 (+) Transcript_10631:100-825(+)
MPEDITWLVDKALAEGKTIQEFISSRFSESPKRVVEAEDSHSEILAHVQASQRRLAHLASRDGLESGFDDESRVRNILARASRKRWKTSSMLRVEAVERAVLQQEVDVPGLEIVHVSEGISRGWSSPEWKQGIWNSTQGIWNSTGNLLRSSSAASDFSEGPEGDRLKQTQSLRTLSRSDIESDSDSPPGSSTTSLRSYQAALAASQPGKGWGGKLKNMVAGQGKASRAKSRRRSLCDKTNE